MTFIPPSWFKQGIYDLRIRVGDTDNASSGWIVYESAFEIIDNIPLITNYDKSNSEVYRNYQLK